MKNLNELLNDPEVQKAKKLLIEAVCNKNKEIQGVKDADPELEGDYKDLLEIFEKMRGGPLFYPYIGSGSGNGALVQLMDGSVKYDFISGIGVHCFGHSHPDIIDSALNSALSDTVMEGHLQQNYDAYELTKLLLEVSGLDHCFLTSTGAMANENAFKICFQKNYPADRVLAFEHCFMGRTIVMSQVTDKAMNRKGLPLSQPVDYIPFFDRNRPEESTKEAAKALKTVIERYPGRHALMSFELVQGEGGFNVGSESFFKTLMAILKESNIAVAIDEVQTFGRTSKPFAFQHFGLEEYVDVVTIGKLSQACATLYKAPMRPAPGLLSQTFTTSSSALRTSKTIIEKLLSDGHFGPKGKNLAINKRFSEKFEDIKRRHPDLIDGPWGLGCMVAFTPLKGDKTKVLLFAKELFKQGVMGFVAGSDPTRCRFLVPMLAITEKDIDESMSIVEKTLLLLKR